MKRLVCFLLVVSTTVSAMWRSKSFIKPSRNIQKVALRPVTAIVPHQLQTFQHWTAQQKPEVQKVINKYNITQRYDHLLTEHMQGNEQVTSQINLLQNMMNSIMQDPEQAEEVLKFYVQLNQANAQVHQALDKMPKEFQELLDKQVQEYAVHVQAFQQAHTAFLTTIQRLKMFMVRSYPYVVCAILLGIQILVLIEAFLQELKRKDPEQFKVLKKQLSLYSIPEQDRSHIISVQDSELLEALDILVNAFSLENISIYKSTQPYSASETAFAAFIPSSELIIILFPKFFEQSSESQLFTLLHEIRHVIQYSEGIRFKIPQDLIQLAVSLGVKKNNNSLLEMLLLSRFYSEPMREFDADAFAVLQLRQTNIPEVESRMVHQTFNSEFGYLSGDLITKLAGPVQERSVFEKMSGDFSDYIARLKGENMYIRLLPDHIKQQAKENRAKKQKKEPSMAERFEPLVDRGW